jgi:carbamate kinase
MIAEGWDVVVTHGNGPQVGFLLRRSELSRHELHDVPLDICGADTQGAIGYMLQRALHNELRRLGVNKQAVSVVTQTIVDQNDVAFKNPSKPVGSFLSEDVAVERADQNGWTIVEDAGRGWRRVVPSPTPKRIVELDVIRSLIDDGYIVVAVGGGGIPVIEDGNGDLEGVEAVIDKDLASALLATSLDADLLLISTAVERVAVNFNTPEQRWLDTMTLAEARAYQEAGHFGKGSMGPKIAAVVDYLERGGKKALITNPENIIRALNGEAGSVIVP